jgi:RND family efflux transporter MFP subunit
MPMIAAMLACGGPQSGDSTGEVEDAAVLVTPDNMLVVDSATIEAGPSLSGSLTAARVAQIRAELTAAVVSVSAERGERVARGTTLGRLDDTSVRDNFLSARSAVTTAEQAEAVARRNVERSEALLQAGAISESALEDARLQLQTAESQLADARARLASAQSQLAKTEIRAPFDGIVSERAVSAGDVVQPGTALFTVVDPRSMRLEGAVAANELESVRTGVPVHFTVTGYGDRVFEGVVARVSPTADPATGQIPVIATIPNAGGELVGGLYAEGQVAAESRMSLVVPLAAVEMDTGGGAQVLRLEGGVTQRVRVQTGLRDRRTERIEITAGLEAGDTLLTGAARTITPGTTVRIQTLESGAASR